MRPQEKKRREVYKQMNMDTSLGEFIREKRKALGLTQEELCEKVGIEQGYLTQIERNKRIGSPETIVRIARALGIKPPYKIFAVFDEEEQEGKRILIIPEVLTDKDYNLLEDIVTRFVELRKIQSVSEKETEEMR
jgi:transcriptional regulator with XRE-family HTH domain